MLCVHMHVCLNTYIYTHVEGLVLFFFLMFDTEV